MLTMIPHQTLALLLETDGRIWLIDKAVDSDVDPGHWGLPEIKINDVPPRPLNCLCGVSTALGHALDTLLSTQLGWDLAQLEKQDAIKKLELWGEVHSPAWLEAKIKKNIVHLSVDANAPELGRSDEATMWRKRFTSGRLLLNPISRMVLDHFSQKLSGDTLTLPDWEEPLAGLFLLPAPSRTLPPATHTNAYVFGRDRVTVVDPSPKDEQSYTSFKNSLSQWRPTQILLTHHHADHHQYAPRLAKELCIPILMSEDTSHRIPRRWGPDYFKDNRIQILNDGDIVGDWQGQAVHAVHVPGHDAGHMALLTEDRTWMLVGDLIQGIGTVVIGKDEGNMADYFRSLEKVIALDPKVILPSHGQAMASTYRIQETLRHRQLREAHILNLHQQGLDVPEMLNEMYAGVPKALWPLAQMNIEGHLNKLRDEGRLN